MQRKKQNNICALYVDLHLCTIQYDVQTLGRLTIVKIVEHKFPRLERPVGQKRWDFLRMCLAKFSVMLRKKRHRRMLFIQKCRRRGKSFHLWTNQSRELLAAVLRRSQSRQVIPNSLGAEEALHLSSRSLHPKQRFVGGWLLQSSRESFVFFISGATWNIRESILSWCWWEIVEKLIRVKRGSRFFNLVVRSPSALLGAPKMLQSFSGGSAFHNDWIGKAITACVDTHHHVTRTNIRDIWKPITLQASKDRGLCEEQGDRSSFSWWSEPVRNAAFRLQLLKSFNDVAVEHQRKEPERRNACEHEHRNCWRKPACPSETEASPRYWQWPINELQSVFNDKERILRSLFEYKISFGPLRMTPGS